MVNFRKFLLPNKPVIFLKIFREIYICPKDDRLGGGPLDSGVWCSSRAVRASVLASRTGPGQHGRARNEAKRADRGPVGRVCFVVSCSTHCMAPEVQLLLHSPRGARRIHRSVCVCSHGSARGTLGVSPVVSECRRCQACLSSV